jgi:hypothetical protein
METIHLTHGRTTRHAGYALSQRKRGLSFFKDCRHWRILNRHKPKEKVVYLLERIGFVAMEFQRSFARRFYRLFPAIRPVCITPKNLSIMFDATFQNYEPQLYKGRWVLLKAREAEVRFYDSFDRRWTRMFADGLEIHEIPA